MKKQTTPIRNIWMVTREYGDLAGAGGVKDVAAQLSKALAAWNGRRVSVVMPCYGFIDMQAAGFTQVLDHNVAGQPLSFEVDMNYAHEERREPLQVWHGKADRVSIYLLDSPRFREKGAVYTYTAKEQEIDPLKRQGEGHYDYFAMNLLLQKGALQLMLRLGERPDVIHCHDGHTAVLPAIIRENLWLQTFFRDTGCLVTVHNAGIGYHQDVDDLPYAHAMTGLPARVVLAGRLADSFDPLVTAAMYAEINTVSENYARELQESSEDGQTGWLGHRLLDMGKKLEGITNGIDPVDFDPKKGAEIGLAAAFDPLDDSTMRGKETCKENLLAELGEGAVLANVRKHGFLQKKSKGPLFTFIGRLSTQKGVDILHSAVLELSAEQKDFQLLILGSGTASIERDLTALAEWKEVEGKVCFLAGYDPKLAIKLYAAGDFFLVPSRYEPCGLTDFIAQLFANLPVVHQVGGLVKVQDMKTGFAYSGTGTSPLVEAMNRAIVASRDRELIRKMQKEAVQLINEKYTWQVVKNHYLKLYREARLEIMPG